MNGTIYLKSGEIIEVENISHTNIDDLGVTDYNFVVVGNTVVRTDDIKYVILGEEK